MKQLFTAASVEEAKELAAREFGVSEEKISFNVIEEPKKGLFGKIKGEAKVEAEYTRTKVDIAVDYVKSVMQAMEITNVTVSAQENEEGAVIEVNGDGFEEMLGKKGELLDSLQYLTSLACNRIDRDYFRISIAADLEKEENNSLKSLRKRSQITLKKQAEALRLSQ